MRILHVITSLYIGGAEHLLVDMLPRLSDGGNNQIELLLLNGVETQFKKKLEQSDVKIHSLSMTNDVYNPKKLLGVRRFLSQNSYDIIHTHNTACQFFVPLARVLPPRAGKLVTTEHSSNNRRRDKRWLRPVDRWMYNRYDAIICISDPARNSLEGYIGKQANLVTIYNGVDVDSFLRPIKDIAGQERFVITMVAGSRPEKDHETLLRAMTHLPDNYRLQLVGAGPRDKELKEYTSGLGLNDRVAFLGVRSDVPDVLEQSDIAVLSSHWEGFGLSAVEGMASGRPFVASDVNGLNEVVGGAGVLFPHGDDKALAEKIQWLCEHPDEYREVASRCQEKARKYDISVTIDKYLELYNELYGA